MLKFPLEMFAVCVPETALKLNVPTTTFPVCEVIVRLPEFTEYSVVSELLNPAV